MREYVVLRPEGIVGAVVFVNPQQNNRLIVHVLWVVPHDCFSCGSCRDRFVVVVVVDIDIAIPSLIDNRDAIAK